MRARSIVSVVLTLVWLASPRDLAAQERSGFWFGVGGGFGSAGVSCGECGDSDRESSGAVYLKGGWTVSPRTLVGMELNRWSKDDSSDPEFGGTINMYNFSGTLTLYPQQSSGLFVKGGAGVALLDVDVKGLGSSASFELGKGLGFVLGAGYDIPLSRRISLTPAVNYWYGRPGDISILGTTLFSDWKQNVVDFTIGITLP